MPVSDTALIDAIQAHGSQGKAAKALGINLRTVERRLKALRLRGWNPEHDQTHPVPDGQRLRGASTLYDRDGKVAMQWVKSQVDPDRVKAIIDEMVQASVKELPVLPPRRARGHHLKELHTVYPIGDAHIGMRAWRDETGKDWDLEIARRVQCGAMDALVQASPAAEGCTIVDLGDWLHYDSMAAETPRSRHPLDVDGRYAKVIEVGIAIMRRAVESALEKHKTVHVICIPGNHNETGALWMSRMLAHVYEKEKRVTVDTQPSLFSYFEFGSTLVGVHHGHTCKMKDLPAVMATDRPEMWGRSKFRYWMTGHVHHQQILELPGCTVESFNTLASNDAYATAGGWRSRQNMKAIVLHKDHGEVARHTVNPEMLGETP